MAIQSILQFPAYASTLEEIIEEHKQFDDRRLLLAIYYAPGLRYYSPDKVTIKPDLNHDVYLFEVYDRLGKYIEEQDDTDLFDVGYGSTEALPLEKDQYLHILLATPNLLQHALAQVKSLPEDHLYWSNARMLKQSIKSGSYVVLYKDPESEHLLEWLGE